MNSAGLQKQHNVKASTLESWLVTFVRLISNLTTDARGERNGAALLCKGLFEKLDNESKSRGWTVSSRLRHTDPCSTLILIFLLLLFPLPFCYSHQRV
jgi:hypothetical protein